MSVTAAPGPNCEGQGRGRRLPCRPVRAQLAQFGAAAPIAALDAINVQRRLINAAKHEDEYFATEADYRTLVKAVADFWDTLASQEEFTI